MNVVFSCEDVLLGIIPNPTASIRQAPQYFRQIKPQSSGNPSSGTVKRCVPFLDALSAGFIIPMWCDVYILARDGHINIEFPPNFQQTETLGTHSAAQIPNHPLSNWAYGNVPLKWINPWVVTTDPGVSCLFTSPLNHMETRFKLLDGVVDTDTYYNNVNLPFLWTGGDGEFFIAKGTPLVQVIPFRREEQHLEVTPIDDAKRRGVIATLGTKLKNGYRDELWHGKKTKAENQDHQVSNLREQPAETQVPAEEPSEPQPETLTDAEFLHQNGYVVLRNIITQADAEQITQRLRDYIEKTGAQPDPMCPSSKAVHGMPASDELLEMLTPVVSRASGKNLIPTYSYARMYVSGERLPKHRDRPACQYSITLCLGMDGAPWPIFMSKTEEDAGSGVSLEVGDGVLYLGMDMHHYREPFEGQWQAQVFLHWVDGDGPHADQKYDGRVGLGHHQPLASVDENLVQLQDKQEPHHSILEVSFEG
jgi:hypothetical protein